MAIANLSNAEIRMYQNSDEGRAYLEYHAKTGGEPYGYCIGIPYVDDIIGLYNKCIKEDKTWYEVLGISQDANFDEIPLD